MIALDLLIEGANEVFTAGHLGVLSDAVVGVLNGKIAYVGSKIGLETAGFSTEGTQRLDAANGLVTPGLVECHTHVVFAGDRSGEYALRAAGADYLEIAAAGGGIAATMRGTRAATEDELVALAKPRLDRLLACGVTTAEVKSGYGLSHDAELKMLRAVKRLNETHPISLLGTFLGAHTIPPDRRDDRDGYLNEVIEQTMPVVAQEKLARFCDVFVENGSFTLEEAERVLRAGLSHGLKPKVHADQLSAGGGAELAGRLGAVSADHLERISDAGIQALAKAGTVAVLLPGAALFLGEDHRPPARKLIDAGVHVALSTDCNPGTCMSENLLLMLTLGMSRLGMTPKEVLEAVTINAARALDLETEAGVIEVGRTADLAIFNVPSHVHLPYHFGVNHTRVVIKGGEVVFGMGRA